PTPGSAMAVDAATAAKLAPVLWRLISLLMYSALDVGCAAGTAPVCCVDGMLVDPIADCEKVCVATSARRDVGGVERSRPAVISTSRLTSLKSTSASWMV